MAGKRVWTAALAAGCLLAGRLAAQPAADAEGARVAELFSRARPALEAALGYALEGEPRFRVTSVGEQAAQPQPDLEAYLGWHFAGLDAAARARTVRALRAARASAAVARYDEDLGVILVAPAQQDALAAWDPDLKAASAPAFLQLALVQEAARQALDRRYGLARRRAACGSAEEHQVFQALVEGRALWVTREVARRLGTEAYFPLLAERLRHVPDPSADPGVRAAVQTGLRQEHWACVRGLAFFAALEGAGLPGAEQRAFARPPAQVRWVEEPGLYLAASPQGRGDLAALLGRVEGSLPGEAWRPAQQPWTPEMMGQAASLLGARERADKLLASWRDGRSLVWTAPSDPGRMVAVSVVRFDGPEAARSYFGFAVDMQRKQEELLAAGFGGAARVVQSRASGLTLPGLDEGARFDRLLQIGPANDPTPACQVVGRAGDLVLELSWRGVAADAAWAERVLRALLDGAR